MDTPKFHPRISLNLASAFNWPLDRSLDFFLATGIGNITPALPRLGDNPVTGIRRIGESGLDCVSLVGGIHNLLESGTATLEALQPLIDTAAALGAPSCYCLSGPAPPGMPTDHAFDRLAALVGPAVDHARGRGISLAIEHNSVATRKTGFVNTLADAATLSRETGLGICVELQNCWYERDLPRLFRENAHRFILVQCSDFVVGETLSYNRAVPGDGDIPLEWLIGELLDGGYRGFFDLEFLGPRIEDEGYESAIPRGLAWLSERLDAWGV